MICNRSKPFSLLLMLGLILSSVPQSVWACACGCGVFDVGTTAMLPTHKGGMAYVEYDYLNQDKNWHRSSNSSEENNEDRNITTRFYTAGGQYLFNQRWGVGLDIPYSDRRAKMMMDDGMGGEMEMIHSHSSLGDIRLRGIFTGFSRNMATGLTFGIKFPSGAHDFENFDRDMQIGTGSTDLLLGGFHRGAITDDNVWNYFLNAQANLPVLITPHYRPGDEINAIAGVYYEWLKAGAVRFAPVAQLIGSVRWSDTGTDAAHEDSGYKRVVLSPGFEFSADNYKLYADVGFSMYQYVNGQQLVATRLYKVNISRSF